MLQNLKNISKFFHLDLITFNITGYNGRLRLSKTPNLYFYLQNTILYQLNGIQSYLCFVVTAHHQDFLPCIITSLS